MNFDLVTRILMLSVLINICLIIELAFEKHQYKDLKKNLKVIKRILLNL